MEPTASSNVFLIHGKACTKSEWHPTCSHEEEGVEPLGKLYAINFKELMGDDWRVRYQLLNSCHLLGFLPAYIHIMCICYLTGFIIFGGKSVQICGDDEYEKVSLPTPERCLLGRNVSATRRKADSKCFNGRGWQGEKGWDEFCDCDWVRPVSCSLWQSFQRND